MKPKLTKYVETFLILVLFLISNLGILGVSFSKTGAVNSCEEVALQFLRKESKVNPKLIGAIIDSPCLYADKLLHEHFIVYAIRKGTSIIGRIVLLKAKNSYIVLEMAETPPPHTNYITEITKYISFGVGESIGQLNFIYVFPLMYYIHLNTIKEGKKVRDVYFFFNERRVVSVDEIPEERFDLDNGDLIKEQDTTSIKVLWDVPEYTTNNVTLCNSCGPVAGANILGYYHKHGYPNLQKAYDENLGVDLITCLFHDMQTSCIYGTPPFNFTNGIVYHANNNHNGYECNYHFVAKSGFIYSMQNAYKYICAEIDNNRPLGILVSINIASWHWITGIGYDSTNNGSYVYVRDGWNPGYAKIYWYAPYLVDPSTGEKVYIGPTYLSYVYPSY